MTKRKRITLLLSLALFVFVLLVPRVARATDHWWWQPLPWLFVGVCWYLLWRRARHEGARPSSAPGT
jgi:hypothetical protein